MCLSIALKSKVGCFSVGLPSLGPMLIDSLLDLVPVSALVTANIYTASFVATMFAFNIGLIIFWMFFIFTFSSVCLENTCKFYLTFSVKSSLLRDTFSELNVLRVPKSELLRLFLLLLTPSNVTCLSKNNTCDALDACLFYASSTLGICM